MCAATDLYREASLRSNLWKLFAFAFLNEFWLIAPVLFPYYQSSGLDAAQGLGVQACYAVGVILFEVPSGYLADRFGRKPSLIASAILLMLGLSLYALAGSFALFALAELIIAAGNSLRSGTDSAMICDTLIELDREKEYTVWQGRSEMWMRFGMAAASVLGGVLAAVSLKTPFWVNIGTGLGMLLLALLLLEPRRQKLDASPWRGIGEVVASFVRTPVLRRTTLLAAFLQAAGVIGVWSYVLYFQACALPITVFGALFAAFGICCGAGARFSAAVSSRVGERTTLWAAALLIPAGFVLLSLAQTRWLVPVSWLNGWLWNLTGPLLLTRVNEGFTSVRRATAISVMRLVGSVSYAASGPLFGQLADTRSLSLAYQVLAGALAVGASLTLVGWQRGNEISSP